MKKIERNKWIITNTFSVFMNKGQKYHFESLEKATLDIHHWFEHTRTIKNSIYIPIRENSLLNNYIKIQI